jgi:L-threonylcarbamoyladenylate synthase
MSTGQFVSRCTADAMTSAAASIAEGNLVAFPTEAIYTLLAY